MKQHSTKRRVLSILLSAMMLLSMIPAAVFQSSAAANACRQNMQGRNVNERYPVCGKDHRKI